MSYWTNTTQPSTIFGWNELLEDWNTSFIYPGPIYTVIENLNQVVNNRLTCSQFKNYLNYEEEQEGIQWFLYECIMRKHLWSSFDFINFIRQLTDEVALDTQFPLFVGSPRGITIREFLETHLTGREVRYLDLMPPLVRMTDPLPPSTTNGYDLYSRNYQTRAASPPRSTRPTRPKYATFQIRIIRKVDGDESADDTDDIITLAKKGDDTYTFTYHDPMMDGTLKKMVVNEMKKEEVLTRLSQIFRLMKVDSLPFEAIQLLIPAYPSTMLNVKELDSYTRDLIYDSVDNTMTKWPVLNSTS